MPNLIAETVSGLKDSLGEGLEQVLEFRGETTVILSRAALLDALRFLKETPGLGYQLISVTAYDDWPVEPRFNVVYHLRELGKATFIRLKVRVANDDAVLPSATGLYPLANWYERELWDLFGVRFTDHPDHRRILMPHEWEGHPLRKDYPLGYEEVEFTFNFDEIEKKKPYAKE